MSSLTNCRPQAEGSSDAPSSHWLTKPSHTCCSIVNDSDTRPVCARVTDVPASGVPRSRMASCICLRIAPILEGYSCGKLSPPVEQTQGQTILAFETDMFSLPFAVPIFADWSALCVLPSMRRGMPQHTPGISTSDITCGAFARPTAHPCQRSSQAMQPGRLSGGRCRPRRPGHRAAARGRSASCPDPHGRECGSAVRTRRCNADNACARTACSRL